MLGAWTIMRRRTLAMNSPSWMCKSVPQTPQALTLIYLLEGLVNHLASGSLVDGFIPGYRSRGALARGPRQYCASWALSTAEPAWSWGLRQSWLKEDGFCWGKRRERLVRYTKVVGMRKKKGGARRAAHINSFKKRGSFDSNASKRPSAMPICLLETKYTACIFSIIAIQCGSRSPSFSRLHATPLSIEITVYGIYIFSLFSSHLAISWGVSVAFAPSEVEGKPRAQLQGLIRSFKLQAYRVRHPS